MTDISVVTRVYLDHSRDHLVTPNGKGGAQASNFAQMVRGDHRH